MMDSSTFKAMRVSVQGTFALLVVAIIPSLAMAQLRTGRGTRAIYQDNVGSGVAFMDIERELGHSILQDADVDLATYQQPSVPDQAPEPIPDPAFSDAAPVHTSDTYGHSVSSTTLGTSCNSGCSSGCNNACCNDCSANLGIAPTASGLRLFARAEVPLFWRRDQGPPALVTTSPVGTGADIAGELGQATTTVLLGQAGLQDDPTAGVRLTFGATMGPKHCYGLLVRYWNSGDQDLSFNFDSNTTPILARPFFDTTTAGSEAQQTQLIGFPSEATGNISVNTQSSAGGIELMITRELYVDRFNRINWISGYQNVQIDEGIRILSNTEIIAPGPLQGAMVSVLDNFQTQNEFHGGVYGLMNTKQLGKLNIETMFRLGAGNLQRRVNISGVTTRTSSGLSNTANQGLLARNTNNQPFVDDTFIVIPELAINLGYQIRPGFDFTVGYNYMVIPKVGQAAQQINPDLAVNLSDPLVGALDPSFSFEERNYWLHSLGLGLQLKY
ncbi:MAG: BBP7 family outer membrane beta-barrel protein [Planctomycetota bacterium]